MVLQIKSGLSKRLRNFSTSNMTKSTFQFSVLNFISNLNQEQQLVPVARVTTERCLRGAPRALFLKAGLIIRPFEAIKQQQQTLRVVVNVFFVISLLRTKKVKTTTLLNQSRNDFNTIKFFSKHTAKP